MKKLAIVIMLAIFVISCSEGRNSGPLAKKDAKSEPIKEISLAKVNNSSITAEDLRDEFNRLNPQAQKMFMVEGGFQNLLDELVKKEMLYQEAKKRDYASDKEFEEIMDDYKKRVMIGLLLRDEVENKSQVSDDEVRKYYDDHQKDFRLETPEKGKSDVVDFDSVKDLIRNHLESQKQAEVFDSYMSKLKDSYNVQIDNAAFSATFGNIAAPPQEKEPPQKEETQGK